MSTGLEEGTQSTVKGVKGKAYKIVGRLRVIRVAGQSKLQRTKRTPSVMPPARKQQPTLPGPGAGDLPGGARPSGLSAVLAYRAALGELAC
jgi:hypothetical protein